LTPAPLAQVTPSAPWHRQPHESEDDFACFAIWALTTPRPPIPAELRLVALNNGWEERAAMIDGRLAQARPLAEIVRNVGLDAISVLSTELEAMAAASRARPGQVRPKDVIQLLGLVSALGGFDAIKPADADAAAKPDWSRLETEELLTLERLHAKAYGR
jgi:hypothetical protein